MTRWLKNLIGLAIIFFLLWYLSRHWLQLKPLFKLSIFRLSVLFALYFATTLIGGAVVKLLVTVLRTRTAFWNMVWLNNAAAMLNYLPFKFGTIFRANYLKHYYGLSYTRFVVFFMYVSLLTVAVATGMGFIALLVVYGLTGYESKILAFLLAIVAAGSMLFLFVPLPVPSGKRRLVRVLREFIAGRKEIYAEKKNILISCLLLVLNYFLTASITWLIYRSLDTYIHPAGCLILGSLGYVVLFVGITPGGLGIRELVLGFGAAVLGVPLQIGVLAAMLDRAVVLAYVFIVGGASGIWLWHKCPADFKKNDNLSII